MKKLLLAVFALGAALSVLAQDSTSTEKSDTIRVGGMVIIKKPGEGKHSEVTISNHRHKKPSNISTNWWIVDIGFANVNDKTNYSNAISSGFVAPGIGKDQLELKTGKSVNVNLWFFLQRLNVIKHVVNLKYGLGLELNNYHFDNEQVRFNENPTHIFLDPTLVGVKKDKLAADYVTIPFMINFNFTPGRDKGFGLSAGVSAGYLYSARQKIKVESEDDKIMKLHDDFDLQPWKLSYIAELNLGPVKLYGSYAIDNMWEKGLDQRPYNFGIRLSNW